MAAVPAIHQTTIGKKALMAITGIIGYGYVILHMIGNLHAFEGEAYFNEYAEFLRTAGAPVLPYEGLLWIIRIVLIVAVVVHVWMAIDLSRLDLASRPVNYRNKKRVAGGFAAMTMRWGGVAIFFFIIYHLTHLTFGWTHPNAASWQGHESAYQNVVAGFSNPIAVAIYLVALFALGMHLYHGIWSMFQTLGFNGRRTEKIWRGLAMLSGVGLFVGFAVVPIAVLAGIIR